MKNSLVNLTLAQDWIIGTLLVILILLVVVKLMYQDRLLSLITLIFSKSYLVRYGKDSNLIFNGFNGLLLIISTLTIGLFLYLVGYFYRPSIMAESGLNLFIKLALITPFYLLLRFVLGWLLATLFEVKTQQLQVVFSKMSYLFCAVISILPFLLLTFLLKNHNFFVFKITILVFGGLLVVRYLNIMIYNKNALDNQWSNFFLYLCALEIAPILLFLKTIW